MISPLFAVAVNAAVKPRQGELMEQVGLHLLVVRPLVRLPLDQLHPVVDQVAVEVFELLLGELDLLETLGDLVVVEKPFFEPFVNELLDFFDLRKLNLDRLL